MSINCSQLRHCIIRPTLKDMGFWSLGAETLLLSTAAVESHMGTYIKQVGGPALGVYQMEPITHDDIVENYLAYRQPIRERLMYAFGLTNFEPERLLYDLRYATVMGRLHYLRVREALPTHDNIGAMALYWKQYYNTQLGAGTVAKFVEAYERFVK